MELSPDTEAARTELQRTFLMAFCKTLHASRLPPLTVLMLAAEALGAIYKEASDEHRCIGLCPCGWEPAPGTDIDALQAALAAAAIPVVQGELRHMDIAGCA